MVKCCPLLIKLSVRCEASVFLVYCKHYHGGIGMKINQIIKERRKKQGLTQEQIAECLGVSIPAVSKWEKGCSFPDITLLPGLARLLKIDLNTLLSFNEDLTDIEIRNISKEVQRKIEEGKFDDGFQLAMSAIRDFPTSEDLIYTLVLALNTAVHILPAKEQSTYRLQIENLFQRLSESKNDEIRKEAVSYLFARCCERKDFEKAEKILSSFPFDKKTPIANMYMQQGKYTAAAIMYESRLLENVSELQIILIGLTEVALFENRKSDALSISNILEKMTGLFDLMDCTAYTAQIECAVKHKDVEKSIFLLSHLLDTLQKKWDIKTSVLYRHLDFSHTGVEHFSPQLLPTFIEYLENDAELDFLQGKEEFQILISQYKQKSGD